MSSPQDIGNQLYRFIERSTETMGAIATPIAQNPLVKLATQLPGMNWFMAALGQVNVAKVEQAVADLRRSYPQESNEQLAQRVITESAWRAAGIGLVTNLAPPLAFLLFAVDLGAIAALQSEMICRIAAIYGFPPHEPTRRGEVLTIWGLSVGGSGAIKTGLSVVELIPGIGAVVGVTSDAALLSGLGYLAVQFYQKKVLSTETEGGSLT